MKTILASVDQAEGQMGTHAPLGFTQPETLNDWPLRNAASDVLRIRPMIASSSAETLRHTALAARLPCFVDYVAEAVGKQPFDA